MSTQNEQLKRGMWHYMAAEGNIRRRRAEAKVGPLISQRIFDNFVEIGNSAIGYLQSARNNSMLAYYFAVGERDQIWLPLQVTGMLVPRIQNARTLGRERIDAWNGLQDAMYGEHAPMQSPEDANAIYTTLRGLLVAAGATNFQPIK